jgi:hypothetical protein
VKFNAKVQRCKDGEEKKRIGFAMPGSTQEREVWLRVDGMFHVTITAVSIKKGRRI